MSDLMQVFDKRKFSLSNARISYLMQVTDEDILEHLYFGVVLTHPEHFQSRHKRMLRPLSPEFQDVHQFSLHDIEQDEDTLKAYIQRFKDSAEDVINGSFHRVFYSDNEVCWQLNSADRSTVHVGYFSILASPNAGFKRAYLRHLEAQALYKILHDDALYSGSALMYGGLDLPYVSATQNAAASPSRLAGGQRRDVLDGGDFSSIIITLKKFGN